MAESQPISWRVHLHASPEQVFSLLTTSEGRARFWAESAVDDGQKITWVWTDGMTAQTDILECVPPTRFVLKYFGGSTVTFVLNDDGSGGTDLLLTDAEVSATDWQETHAGWVSVLLALKAAVDHRIDLRNHDPQRTWDQGYVDN
ncbi:MAG TPA: SRPBCC domain-containing protein [Ktedonobacterales bacterium]|nr:SRPBCC domain-containing protein [Ktedonobacterales bacterium]